MRVGVSAKVFLAYAVLLVALGANSAFSVASLQSAGERVVAHRSLLEVESKVQGALRQLAQLGPLGDPFIPMLAGTYLKHALDNMADGRRSLEGFLTEHPATPRRIE